MRTRSRHQRGATNGSLHINTFKYTRVYFFHHSKNIPKNLSKAAAGKLVTNKRKTYSITYKYLAESLRYQAEA